MSDTYQLMIGGERDDAGCAGTFESFRLDRGDGAFLGALALHYGVAGTLFIAILIIWVAATAPDVPVLPLLLVSFGVTGGAILVFYPFSKTLWAAIDVMLHRMDRTDRSSDVRDQV